MGWKFWQAAKYAQLSDGVRRSLRAKFDLGWDEINRMRCVGENGQYDEKPVRYIHIFDPALIQDKQKPLRRPEDLADDKDAILFEVRVEEDESMYVTDMRTDREAPESVETHNSTDQDRAA